MQGAGLRVRPALSAEDLLGLSVVLERLGATAQPPEVSAQVRQYGGQVEFEDQRVGSDEVADYSHRLLGRRHRRAHLPQLGVAQADRVQGERQQAGRVEAPASGWRDGPRSPDAPARWQPCPAGRRAPGQSTMSGSAGSEPLGDPASRPSRPGDRGNPARFRDLLVVSEGATHLNDDRMSRSSSLPCSGADHLGGAPSRRGQQLARRPV